MMKTFLIPMLTTCLLTFAPIKKVEVISYTKAMRVNPGYYVKEEDSTFIFKGNKYLVTTQVNYKENGTLDNAMVYGDVGYLTYSNNELGKYKNIIEDYGLIKRMEVSIINVNLIALNQKNIYVEKIDNKSKTIFYFLNQNKKNIYLIKYK
ncbi:hypothetical protein ACFE6N_23185 [Pedobacter sp. BG31]|uniref:hypothetical protein n=1 Tax=Pedobacter sp. BG31 TaxID=3349697 RepID=UPI0035F2ED55